MMRKIAIPAMTRADAQKVADAMNMTVYFTNNGVTTNPVGLTIIGEPVEPTVNTKTVPHEHGIGDGVPLDYATPRGDGTKL